MVKAQQHFVPIGNVFDEDRRLIEQVFGHGFFVTDDAGHGVTTLRNHRLLGYAKEIVARAEGFSHRSQSDDLARLGQLADTLTPADCQRARGMEPASMWRFIEFDHAERAGCLE